MTVLVMDIKSWRVSSWTNGSNCVEVGNLNTAILLRDTKNRTGTVLSFAPSTWEEFVTKIRAEKPILK
jgi:hypothetical protein